MYYYYDGTRCTIYATYGQTCAAATYGPFCNTVVDSLVCSGTTCTCSAATTFYNGSSCVSYISVGFACTASSQCQTNAYCSSGICTCSSSYYFNTATGSCLSQLTVGQACATSTQCSTNMVCTAGSCTCISGYYPVGTACVAAVSYGGACSATTLCDSSRGLQCTSSVCQCNSTQYWSTLSNGTQTCANLRTLGQSCTTYTDCQNSATSVKCITNICECDYSAYYLDQTLVTCVPLIGLGGACMYNFQCASSNCNASSVCGSTIASTITSNVSQASSIACLTHSHMTVIQFFFWIFISTLYIFLLI